MGQVTSALLDMQNQGKATADNVNRISAAGVPAWESLATAMKKTPEEMHAAVSDGKVSMEDMLDAIQKGSGDTFGGLIAGYGKVMGSFENRTKLAKDNVVRAFSDMILPLLDKFGPSVTGLGDMIAAGLAKVPAAIGAIKTFLQPAIQAFKNLWSAAAPALSELRQGFGEGIVGAFGLLGTTINEVVAPALNWIAEQFRNLSPAGQEVFRIIGIVAGGLVAAGVAARGLQSVLTPFTAAFRALNVVMSANPIIRIVTLIGLLVGAFITLWNQSEGFRNFWIGLWNGIKAIVQPVIDWFQASVVPFFVNLWNQLKAIANQFAQFWSAFWNSSIGKATQAVLKMVYGIVKTVFGAIFGVIKGVMSAIGGVIGGAWTAIKSVVSGALQAIKGIIEIVTGLISGDWHKVWQGIKDFFVGIWNGIIGFLKGAVNAVISVINGITTGINKVTGIVGVPAIPQIPKLEKGGRAQGGRMHLVGEKGPELFVPKVSGYVVPNHKLRSNGGTIVRERTQETSRNAGKLAGRMDRVRVDLASRTEDVDASLTDRIERALSGWRVEMDSRGVARLARDGNRRMAPTL